ncbi:hypothetical protein PCCS19_36620 [Paenibacillus sp. CCS19]|uniref:hypothetical protein n=1 Tax=Paenibacillus sp. CCS19 TaxID=3158387 RepID=UPI002564101A|nr:hypothetical protein [Paenibacillus cellulosilyticus]GMK40606.1 hypothetical protein PCCS19_36620 [Paenibacillus cellulosilyticus]
MGSTVGTIMGIIIVGGLFVLALLTPFLLGRLLKKLKKRYLPVKQRITPESQQVMNAMDPEALAMLTNHLKHFNQKMSVTRGWVTPSFLMEAYFPETHTFDPDVSVDEMLRYFDNDYARRSALRSYVLDSYELLKDGGVAVGISRLYEDGGTTHVRFILTKDKATGRWYMDHISRQFAGEIVEQLTTSRNTTMYELQLEEGGGLAYESEKPVPGISVGDKVMADGYLVTHETLEGNIYYRLLRMDKLQ